MGSSVLDREESEVSETLVQALERDGIHLHFNTEVKQVAYADGVFTLTLDRGLELQAEALLVATGAQYPGIKRGSNGS